MNEVATQSDAEVEEQSESSFTPNEYNAWLRATSLNDIAIVAQSSERSGPGESESTRFELEAGYQLVDGGLQYRYNATATIYTEGDIEVGIARAAVVVDVACPDSPSPEAIGYFGSTSVPMMAHPYVREALSTAAARVGFHGITLPLITHQPIKKTGD